jgi:ABC-type uncharacterized transport system permease subunit
VEGSDKMKNLFHIGMMLLILVAYAICLYAIHLFIESAVTASILLIFVAIVFGGLGLYYGFYRTGWFVDEDK